MKDVIVVTGPGQIGQAIARRVGVGKHVLLADLRRDNAEAAAEFSANAGYNVSVATVDASSRDAVRELVKTATGLGEVTGLIRAAGVSPSQASPSTLHVDLYGTALVLEEFGRVIASGGSGASSPRSRAPSAAAHRRAEQRVGDDARGGAARPSVPPARPGDGPVARIPALQARQRAARDGPRRFAGASEARASTRSAPASSLPRLPGTS